jgi:hypothetical protein
MFGFSTQATLADSNTWNVGPSIDPRKREMYMCVPAVRGPLEKSFEVSFRLSTVTPPIVCLNYTIL